MKAKLKYKPISLLDFNKSHIKQQCPSKPFNQSFIGDESFAIQNSQNSLSIKAVILQQQQDDNQPFQICLKQDITAKIEDFTNQNENKLQNLKSHRKINYEYLKQLNLGQTTSQNKKRDSSLKQLEKKIQPPPLIKIHSIIPHIQAKPNNSIDLRKLYNQLSYFDILLFQNQNLTSKLQRIFTGSKCDHAAIIVKYGPAKYILQAGGNNGVVLTDLYRFLEYYEKKYLQKKQKNKENSQNYSSNHQKIITGLSIRKRKSRKVDSQILELLSEFLNKCLGKKYYFHPFYLFTEKFKKKDSGYFCSQLVIDCLKFCNIVPLKYLSKPSYAYLPKHLWGKQWAENEDIDTQLQNSSVEDCLQNYYDFSRRVYL